MMNGGDRRKARFPRTLPNSRYPVSRMPTQSRGHGTRRNHPELSGGSSTPSIALFPNSSLFRAWNRCIVGKDLCIGRTAPFRICRTGRLSKWSYRTHYMVVSPLLLPPHLVFGFGRMCGLPTWATRFRLVRRWLRLRSMYRFGQVRRRWRLRLLRVGHLTPLQSFSMR
jgi:hypothetical protein